MIHCDECARFVVQPTLFTGTAPPRPKKLTMQQARTWRPDVLAEELSDDLLCYCDRSVPMAFQMPMDGGDTQSWGFRPWRSCEHFDKAPPRKPTWPESEN